jgi:septum formation protein
LQDYDLILASASPRRTEILHQIGVRHQIVPADIDETPRSGEMATDYVQRMALEKAQRVMLLSKSSTPVLGADTCVVCDGTIFGKPSQRDEAMDMLGALSGKSHWVHTAVAVAYQGDFALQISSTEVVFRKLPKQECLIYWETGEPIDKAGSYAIQGYGSVFVESIAGSYSGVVGLPIKETYLLLKKFGVPIWHARGN